MRNAECRILELTRYSQLEGGVWNLSRTNSRLTTNNFFMTQSPPENPTFPLPIVDASAADTPVSEKVRTLGTISRLLGYPDEHYVSLTELLYVILQSELPEAASGISEFGRYVEQCGPYELEEAYTRTFDVNPSCALEVGWHLFGEDYVRGQFLVRMRGELARYGITESSELPDHLTHVLAVIGAMPEDEARRLTRACVLPALAKMQRALDGMDSPYRHLLRSLVLVLEQLYGPSEPWSEEDELMPPAQQATGKQSFMSKRRADTHPGQNGPRPPGLGDPLRAYPMPGTFPMASPGGCGVGPTLVPLQTTYSAPANPDSMGPESEPLAVQPEPSQSPTNPTDNSHSTGSPHSTGSQTSRRKT